MSPPSAYKSPRPQQEACGLSPARPPNRQKDRCRRFRWHNHWVNVSHVLGEEYVAFEEIDDTLWQISFGPIVIGRFHEGLLRIEDHQGDPTRTRRRTAPVLPMSSD